MIVLPRLDKDFVMVDKEGKPTLQFHLFWQDVTKQLEVAQAVADATMPDIRPVTIYFDYTGTVLSGQLPKSINVKRYSGQTDVTTESAWSLTTDSGTISASIGATTGIISVASLTSDAILTVTSVHEKVSISRKVYIYRNVAPAPTSGGSGGATSSTDTAFFNISSTTHAPISDELTITTGASGTVDLYADLYVLTSEISPTGVFAVYGIWQWWDGAAWVDQGTEQISNPHCEYTSGLEVIQGHLAVVNSKTGLAASSSQKFRLMARNSAGTRTMSFAGSASAVTS